MLLEFSVQNFRSISDRITFSTVASPSAFKSSHMTVATGNALAPHALTTAVLLGPNNSGKSNIIRALRFFQMMVVSSARRFTQGEELPIVTHKLNPDYSEEPSEFEVVFSHDGEVFQYGFALTRKRIAQEWLFARTSKKGSKTRAIFSRAFEPEKGSYSWYFNDAQLPGERESWKSATRDNALFLSTAVQLNSASLNKPFNWIQEFIEVIGANERIHNSFTAEMLSDPKSRSKIVDFFEALDLHVAGFRVETEPASVPEHLSELMRESKLEELLESIKDEKNCKVFTQHRGSDGEIVELKLEDESDGTQAIFGMIGPIFDVLENGYTLFIDELSNSLHPLALKGLVAIFQDEEQNPHGAQLVFTSHDTSIIRNSFVHKDQIWFVKNHEGLATQLVPLSDYKVRDVEAFQRSYLGGKFGAVPNVRSLRNAG